MATVGSSCVPPVRSVLAAFAAAGVGGGGCPVITSLMRRGGSGVSVTVTPRPVLFVVLVGSRHDREPSFAMACAGRPEPNRRGTNIGVRAMYAR